MDQSILLIEDSKDAQILVRAALSGQYDLRVVETAKEASEVLRKISFDLIILDVNLPDQDGFRFCAEMKLENKNKDTAVIFLTGQDKISDKVMGFSLGAEDYIVKPFNPLEFRARINARMRNITQNSRRIETFELGQFKVQLPLQKILVFQDGKARDLELSSNEFKLLFYFLKHKDHVLSRESILNAVWGEGVHVSDRTVDTHVYTIRKKLGVLSSCIQSVPGEGYRLFLPSKAA